MVVRSHDRALWRRSVMTTDVGPPLEGPRGRRLVLTRGGRLATPARGSGVASGPLGAAAVPVQPRIRPGFQGLQVLGGSGLCPSCPRRRMTGIVSLREGCRRTPLATWAGSGRATCFAIRGVCPGQAGLLGGHSCDPGGGIGKTCMVQRRIAKLDRPVLDRPGLVPPLDLAEDSAPRPSKQRGFLGGWRRPEQRGRTTPRGVLQRMTRVAGENRSGTGTGRLENRGTRSGQGLLTSGTSAGFFFSARRVDILDPVPVEEGDHELAPRENARFSVSKPGVASLVTRRSQGSRYRGGGGSGDRTPRGQEASRGLSPGRARPNVPWGGR